MQEWRSGSQILFGYLPEQTVDLRGRVWRVTDWVNPIHETVDSGSLKRELLRQARPWAKVGNDGRYVENLFRGYNIDVVSLNIQNGVKVESFPNLWVCKKCNRMQSSPFTNCRCGARAWGQLHFVGYHTCGALREPWIPKCATHNDHAVVFPGTASASEIQFVCPVCKRLLRKGFGFPKCECGEGQIQFNVHRAASVYTPRSIVIVNPPSPDRMRQLDRAGGPARAFSWVIDGCQTRWPDAGSHTRASFVQQLIDQGFSPSLAEGMADQAAAAGELEAGGANSRVLEGPNREEAEAQAVAMAMAVAESRSTLEDLQHATDEWSPLGVLYRSGYPVALNRSGLAAVELIDRFPVLTGNFGYTRGGLDPGESKLVPFRNTKGDYVVYADVSETEALLVRLKATSVASWLEERGFALPSWNDEPTARIAILQTAFIPGPGEDVPDPPTAGGELLSLIHSYAHRFIRRAAVFAGIERTALAELLVPLHLGFFVYAAARGDFVLGGLQAAFETELDALLEDVVGAEHRCPLDPGCQATGGACMACLHLGEPSCRYYNAHLNRATLYGVRGYLRPVPSSL